VLTVETNSSDMENILVFCPGIFIKFNLSEVVEQL
jgi:hypothetical protein